jgi:hypothetical protein
MKRSLTLAAAATIAALWAHPTQALPQAFTYSGFLLDSAGNPITIPTGVTFGFFDTEGANTTSPNYTEPMTVAPSADGYFSAILGLTVPNAFFTGNVWVTLKVGAEQFMLPRLQLTSAPAALSALLSPGLVFLSTPIPAGTCNHFFDGASCPAGSVASGVGCFTGVNNVPITNQFVNGNAARCGWCNNTAGTVTGYAYTFCVSSP